MRAFVPFLVCCLPGWLPAQEGISRYQRALQRPEAERAALAEALAADKDPRARALIRSELQAASTPGLRLALVAALRKHPQPELASVLGEAIDRNAPDPTLAAAVVEALLACGSEGIQELGQLLERFATGRSSARERPGVQQAVCAGLAKAANDEAWTVLVKATQRGVPADRHRCLTALASAPPGPAVTGARLAALDSDLPAYVLEGLRQLAQHGPDFDLALLKASRAARGDREKPLRTGIAQLAAQQLTRERFAVFFENAAAVDSSLTGVLASHAQKLRARADLADWVVAQRATWKTADQLTLAAQLAPVARSAEATAFLIELAQTRLPDVIEPAIAALGQRQATEAVPVLRKLLYSPPVERRRVAAAALHRILRADPAWRSELRSLLDQPDTGLQLIALDCLGDLDDQELLPRVYGMFTSADWVVRATAYDFVRRVRAVPSIPLLLARLAEEKGRLREDVVRALRWLTGQNLRTEMQWNAWWRDHSAWFELPPAPKGDPQPAPAQDSNTRSYYSLEVVSDAVAFVVDTSGSMEAKIGTGNERTRLMEAKRQLARVLEGLPATHRVNVIPFASGAKGLLAKITLAAADVKKGLIASVDALRAGGGTNVHAALQLAFADPLIDTIYLLTDGAPSAGAIVEPNALADEVAKWNRTRRITIHCIAVGTDSPLLQRLAKESGGRYVRAR